MDENLRCVTQNNTATFLHRFYRETDAKQRQLFKQLLLWEERWYGLKEERIEALQQCLEDCNRQLSTLRLPLDSGGKSSDRSQTEVLRANLLDVQHLLSESIRKELQTPA